jgi:hypothetical protein
MRIDEKEGREISARGAPRRDHPPAPAVEAFASAGVPDRVRLHGFDPFT